MKLVIAEKPSVARDIARVLKCSERKTVTCRAEIIWSAGRWATW